MESTCGVRNIDHSLRLINYIERCRLGEGKDADRGKYCVAGYPLMKTHQQLVPRLSIRNRSQDETRRHPYSFELNMWFANEIYVYHITRTYVCSDSFAKCQVSSHLLVLLRAIDDFNLPGRLNGCTILLQFRKTTDSGPRCSCHGGHDSEFKNEEFPSPSRPMSPKWRSCILG